MHFRQEYIRCGKSTCWCASGRKRKGKAGHGPYWYGYYYERGKLKKRYFGKQLPGSGRKTKREPKRSAFDRWHIPRRWTDGDAFRVLGVTKRKDAKAAYRKLIAKHHPDRGGDEAKAKAINLAWAHLRR